MPTFPDMLREAIGSSPVEGVLLAPEIPPKKLKGAQKYADFGQETPLVLFDNTTFGSAKSGALVTSQALYASTLKGQRIELSTVMTPPVFDDLDGWLKTPEGTVKLPRMVMHEVQEAFERVLQVILSVNMGAAASSSGARLEGPLCELVAQTLEAPKIDIGSQLPRRKLRAAAETFPDWCDWLRGERVVAYIDETAFGKGDEGLVLTDRRLLGHIGGNDWNIPYAIITDASKGKALMARQLILASGEQVTKISLAVSQEAVAPLHAFFQGLLRLPAKSRRSSPPAYGAPEDPSGVSTLMARLPSAEPRVLVMVQLLKARLEAGQLEPPQAAELVSRIDLLAQTLAFGRGLQLGWLLSPLRADDLVDVLSSVLGPPQALGGDEQTRVADFSFERRGGLGKAAVSTALGVAALAVAGVGWVTTPGRAVRGVRFEMRQLGIATGFTTLGEASGELTPLSSIDAALARQVLSVLASGEALGLLVRVLWGWDVPAQALLEKPAEAMQARAEALLGQTDLSAFFPEHA